MNRIIRPNHASGLLVKEHREGGFLASGLGHVVGIVQTDREELGGARNGRFQLYRGEGNPPGFASDGLAREVESLAASAQERDHLPRKFGRGCSKVNDRFVGDDADAGSSLMRESCEFHLSSSLTEQL